MTDTYDLNDTPALTVTIKDSAAAVIDPTTLVFVATSPIGTATTYTYGTDTELVKSSTGVYYVDLLLNESGRWVFNWTATGNVSLAESSEAWVKFTSKAVTLEQAKDHLNISDSLDDSLIDFMIDSAITIIEQNIGKELITTAKTQYFNCFADEMMLYTGNAKTISSITYLDENDAEQTLSTSIYELDAVNSAVRLLPNQSWPTLSERINPVTVNYTAGYGEQANAIPSPLISTVLLLVGHLYENRESTAPISIHDVPMSVKFLIAPYKDFSK